MAEHKVLITTSGIGSRLGKLTQYTNKSLVRVGDKPPISYIVEKYPEDVEFVITLGHFGNYIKQYLELVYPDRKFNFVEIDNYREAGSSLGYSINKAKQYLQCPFIFHVCDTILNQEDIVPDVKHNWAAGAPSDDTSQYRQYRTLTTNGDYVDKFNEKGEMNFDFAYIGLCGIKDYQKFWKILDRRLAEDPKNSSLSDVHIIDEMNKEEPFRFIKFDGWLDVGNITTFKLSNEKLKSSYHVLHKMDESIYFFDKTVVKFFNDSKVNNNRVKRAKSLYPMVPKIISSSDNYYLYEKVEGELFSECVTIDTFRNFLDWAKTSLWKDKKISNFNKLCEEFYINKTKSRIIKYLGDKKDTTTIINGQVIPPVFDLISSIDTDWLCNGSPSQFHGDFILDNIIKTESGFCLIDWRQDFAGDLEVGDVYYDLAKLNHNLVVNHGIIERELFDHSPEKCHILCSSTLMECQKVLHEFITNEGYDLQKVKVLTSLIWLNMSPLHDYPFGAFLFNFGKYQLAKHLGE